MKKWSRVLALVGVVALTGAVITGTSGEVISSFATLAIGLGGLITSVIGIVKA